MRAYVQRQTAVVGEHYRSKRSFSGPGASSQRQNIGSPPSKTAASTDPKSKPYIMFKYIYPSLLKFHSADRDASNDSPGPDLPSSELMVSIRVRFRLLPVRVIIGPIFDLKQVPGVSSEVIGRTYTHPGLSLDADDLAI